MKHILFVLALALPALFSTAQQQNCLFFDGTDDYVSSPLPAVFTNLANNDFTFETWINIENYSASRVFFAQQDASNFATVLINNGNLIFYVKVSNITYSRAIPAPLAGEWVHVAATWDAVVDFPAIYINGILQPGVVSGASSSGTNNTLTIGSRTDGAQLFNGKIDEVRIWNTARKECEIRSTMHSIPAGNEVDLIHHYNFNRGTAGGNNPTFTVLPDLVGANPGNLMNFGLNGPTSNWVSSTAPLTAVGPQNAYETNVDTTICEGETFTLGTQNLTTSGIYEETFTSIEGCDSLVILQLTVNPAHMPPVMVSTCTSYYWAQTGETYLASGSYTDTLISSYGCDSILTLELTIGQHTTSSQQVENCGPYTWAQNGQLYTVSGQYTDTIPNTDGCDSIITLELTILEPTTATLSVSNCGPYEWPQTGEIYTASGLYYDTIPNSAGCDSLITLNLSILESTASTVTGAACGSFYWEQTGLTYNFSGIYVDTIQNAAGCDSIVSLNLIIHQIPGGTIVHNGGGTLSVNAGGEVAGWIDCATGQLIAGQQGQDTFMPMQNGSYAAIVENTMTLCRDTSDCFVVDFVNINEEYLINLQIAPNPTHDEVMVRFAGDAANLVIRDSQGKIIINQPISSGERISLKDFADGVYLFELSSEKEKVIRRVVKN